jgi:vacuolar-type H+-ATPase subunit H
MNEIVNKVFESEDQARKLLEETRDKISVLQRDLEQEIENINIRAKGQATASLQSLVDKSRIESSELRTKALNEARQKDDQFYIQMESKISSITKIIVDFIAVPEYVREKQ